MIPEDRKTVAQLVVSLIAFGLCLGAYLVLVLTGHDGDGLIRVAITLAGIFSLGSYAAANFRQTHQKLDQVAHQTNGQLDGRIREGAEAAALAALELHEANQRARAITGGQADTAATGVAQTTRKGGPRGAAGA